MPVSMPLIVMGAVTRELFGLASECILKRIEVSTVDDQWGAIDHYVAYYNHKRYHYAA